MKKIDKIAESLRTLGLNVQREDKVISINEQYQYMLVSDGELPPLSNVPVTAKKRNTPAITGMKYK